MDESVIIYATIIMNGTGYCTISSKLSLSEREISSMLDMLYQVLGRVYMRHSEDSVEITSEKVAGIHASFRRFRR